MSRFFADAVLDSCVLLHDVWRLSDCPGMVGCKHSCNDCHGPLWRISMQPKRARRNPSPAAVILSIPEQ